jgi:hypothetical protein
MRIEYEGKVHEFPDGWTDAEIAEALGGQPAAPTELGDAVKNAPSALARGVAGAVGLPGDIARGMRWLTDKARVGLGGGEADPEYVATGRPKGLPETMFTDLVPSPPESGDVKKGIESVTGPLYEPKTRTGKYSGAVLEFLPGAIGPGGPLRNFTRFALAPGLASEAAGHATEGTAAEPYARAAGGLLGLGAANFATRPNAGPRAVTRALRGVNEQEIAQAGMLMQDARVRGIPLTWQEAIDQVTDSRSGLGNLARVTEASPRGGEVMREFYAGRPEQVNRAFDAQMGDIAAVPMTPSQIGPRASEAATGILDRVRQNINARTAPMYRAAEADLVPDRTLARLHRSVPGFTDALATVRGNPHLNDPIRHLPDNSVAVLNEVKKQLDQVAGNVGRPTDPNRNMQIAASAERSATAVRRAGRRASRPYRQALDEQARARQQELNPLQQSPLGAIADAGGDTARAQRALLPEKPLPGSAAETGRTTRLMNAQASAVTRNMVRSRLEGMFNTAARDLQGGPSQFAGAAARARIYGDRQMRRNIQAALSELPNGNQVATGFERLMEIFQATGRRQRIGSQTAFNQEYQDVLRGGRLVGESLTGARKAIRERYQQWRLGQNLDDLARLLTDQGAQQRLLELSRANYADPRTGVLIGQLVEDIAGE